MGIFDFLKITSDENATDNTPQIKIEEKYLLEFQNGIEGQLQLIEAQLYRIQIVYPTGADKIKDGIQEIRKAIEDEVPQIEIQEKFNELKERIKLYTKKANQRYTIEEVKKSIIRLKKVNQNIVKSFETEVDEKNISLIEDEEQYIQSVANRLSEFDGQERDKLIGAIIEARYRTMMGKLFVYYWNGNYQKSRDDIARQIQSAPEVEKVIYAKILREDIDEITNRYNMLYDRAKKVEEWEEELKLKYPNKKIDKRISPQSAEKISNQSDEILQQISNDFIEDFQTTGIFKKREFLLLFADLNLNTNRLKQEIETDEEYLKQIQEKLEREEQERIEAEQQALEEKQRKEQEAQAQREQQEREREEKIARQKEMEEKCKKMTQQEIQSEIKRIDEETFDTKEKYKKIMEIQLAVARAKGLVLEKNLMKSTDMEVIPCDTNRLPGILMLMQKQVILGTGMLGVDDNRETSLLLLPRGEKDSVKEIFNNNLKGYKRYNRANFLGELSDIILSMMPEKKKSNFVIDENSKRKNSYYIYSYFSNNESTTMKELYQSVLKTNENEELKQAINFSVQLPLQRSILPIIEKLKQEGIEFYIPTADIEGFDFKKVEPTYRIYMDRKYLELYKQKVHADLSKNGVILIGDENINIADMLLEGCEFPYELDKKRQKER